MTSQVISGMSTVAGLATKVFEKDQIMPVHRSVVGIQPKKKTPASVVDVIYEYGGGMVPSHLLLHYHHHSYAQTTNYQTSTAGTQQKKEL